MLDKVLLGIIEIIFHAITGLFYIAVLIAAAVTVSITNEIDLFDNDSDASRHADDGESFRAVAGWLIFIAICGIAFEIVMAVTRALVNGEFLVVKFTMYGLVFATISFLLICGLIAGGVPSATSAADVQDNYIDALRCDNEDEDFNFVDVCDDLTVLRNSQIAAATMAFCGVITNGILMTVIILTAKWHG